MARHPLQRGVGDEHVDLLVRPPVTQIAQAHLELVPPDSGVGDNLLCCLDHRCRRVDAEHTGARPALRQQRGLRGGPAAQVDHGAWIRHADPRDELHKGSRPLVGESLVDSWIPHDV